MKPTEKTANQKKQGMKNIDLVIEMNLPNVLKLHFDEKVRLQVTLRFEHCSTTNLCRAKRGKFIEHERVTDVNTP